MSKRMRYWILDADGIPQPTDDVIKWGKFFESKERQIGYYERDGYWVSTVFLGIDHRFMQNGPPLLFETMVFDDVREEREFPPGRKYITNGNSMECERYSTKDDALIGHERHVKELDRKLDYARDVAIAVIKPEDSA